MCGIPPKLSPLPFEASNFGLPARCLPKLLGDLGYQTAFFQSATRHFENRTQLLRNMGFQHIRAFEDMPTKGFTRVNRHLGYEDKIIVKPSFQWIDTMRRQKRPFFVSYLTLASHFYYRLPKGFPSRELITGGDKYMNKYLNTLRYTDSFVAEIYRGLQARGLLKSTLFVVLGDHGEAFMEHGLRFHSDGAYEEFMRVPAMLVHPKGHKAGKWLKGNRQQIDLVPTIAELLGVKLAQGHLPGKSLLQPVSPKRKLYLSCWNVPFCIAKLEGCIKSIFNFQRREHELFDLTKDPLEQRNLRAHATRPAYWKRLEKELMGWRAHVNQLYKSASASVLEKKVTWVAPKVQVRLNVRFGPYIRLVGYRLANDQVKIGRRVKVTFVYEVLKRLPKGWKFLYHAYAIRYQKKAWKEKFINLRLAPLTGALSPQEWKPGTFITDHQSFQLRPVSYKLRRGMHFRLYHGIWHKKSGRLPVHGAHGRPVRGNRLLIFDIRLR